MNKQDSREKIGLRGKEQDFAGWTMTHYGRTRTLWEIYQDSKGR